MKVKVSEATGVVLDWLVAKCEGYHATITATEVVYVHPDGEWHHNGNWRPSTNWVQGGPIIERENITLIRADDTYGVDDKGFTTDERIPQWFAETSKWTGHSLCTSYEGECLDPTFMIGEADGCYGPTPLITAMRCYAAFKLSGEVEVPDELLEKNP